jgi:hypothetical protein
VASITNLRGGVEILFVDESGNIWHSKGTEVIAVAGILAGGAALDRLRKHAGKARRRARPVAEELRFRLHDQRSKRAFFDADDLNRLGCSAWAVAVQIEAMERFRRKHAAAALYEYLIREVIDLAVRDSGRLPNRVHLDPSSHLTSRAGFADRVREKHECEVVYAPDSRRERALQAADMIAGAARRQVLTGGCPEWEALSQMTCRFVELTEAEVRQALRREKQ